VLPPVAVSLVVYGVVARRAGWDVAREVWLARLSGWVALAFLLLALLATPVARLALLARRPLPNAWVSAVRRACGVASALLATTHALVALSGYLGWNWDVLLHRPYLRAGGVALLVLGALAATSFSRVVQVLRLTVWKELHRLAYVAFALALLHLVLSPFAPRLWTLGVLGAVLLLGFLRIVEPARPGAADEQGDAG
jgi:sulfoxide reductase heme-binding subunit YedZ